MKGEISHKGRVLEVTPDVIRVEMISSSACSACHAAGLCSMSESVKKVVEIPAAGNDGYAPGEEVELLLTPSMGMKAVVLAYLVPLAILLVICVSLSYTGMHELYIGLAGLCGVAVWYLALYMLKGRLASEYVFCIRKNNNLNSVIR